MGTVLAPRSRTFHSDDRTADGGGVFSDTSAGTAYAGAHGYEAIDNNGHLMLRSRADRLLPVALRRVTWVNAHGTPFNLPWQKGKKLEQMAWSVQHRRHPDLRSGARTLRENAAHGLDTEWEPKDLHPLANRKLLLRAFRQLARAARKAYGPNWQRRVIVKALTDLGGGLEYALLVLECAHAVGFPTMVLPRGPHAHQVINEPFITYNRGGRV